MDYTNESIEVIDTDTNGISDTKWIGFNSIGGSEMKTGNKVLKNMINKFLLNQLTICFLFYFFID